MEYKSYYYTQMLVGDVSFYVIKIKRSEARDVDRHNFIISHFRKWEDLNNLPITFLAQNIIGAYADFICAPDYRQYLNLVLSKNVHWKTFEIQE